MTKDNETASKGNRARIRNFSLTVLAISLFLLIVAFFYRDDIFQTFQDPAQPFQTYVPPPAPDYTKMDTWLARPDAGIDPHILSAKGDVFIVTPTIYTGGDEWNLSLQDMRHQNKLKRITRPNYVSPYGPAGRLFAPYYRQAALYAFMTAREDAKHAQELAYQDVRRAFEAFLIQSPPERPIVLVGHNQGASHIGRILADFFQGPRQKRLAVAYMIDYPVPIESFDGPLKAQSPCTQPTQTGCVVAFGAFTPNDQKNVERFSEKSFVYNGQDYVSIDNRPTLCVNPLLWTSSEDYAPPRLHLGGVAAEGLDPDIQPAPLAKQVGAQCQNGLLLVDRPRSASLRRPLRFGGRFLSLPSNLFYEDLKQDSMRRVQALLDQGNLPKRAANRMKDLAIIEIPDSPVTLPKKVEQATINEDSGLKLTP